jgi:hypothetical protein
MSTRMIYCCIGAWFGIVAAVTGFGAISGVPITLSTGVFVLAVGLMPPAIMLKLWNDTPAQTVAELLHPVDRHV